MSDTGIGIAPQDQPKVFEEFRQVDSDYAHKIEGTGLGLTLAEKVCRTACGQDLGYKPAWQRLEVYFHAADNRRHLGRKKPNINLRS